MKEIKLLMEHIEDELRTRTPTRSWPWNTSTTTRSWQICFTG